MQSLKHLGPTIKALNHQELNDIWANLSLQVGPTGMNSISIHVCTGSINHNEDDIKKLQFLEIKQQIQRDLVLLLVIDRPLC